MGYLTTCNFYCVSGSPLLGVLVIIYNVLIYRVLYSWDPHGLDCMVDGFTTICAISALSPLKFV